MAYQGVGVYIIPRSWYIKALAYTVYQGVDISRRWHIQYTKELIYQGVGIYSIPKSWYIKVLVFQGVDISRRFYTKELKYQGVCIPRSWYIKAFVYQGVDISRRLYSKEFIYQGVCIPDPFLLFMLDPTQLWHFLPIKLLINLYKNNEQKKKN